MSRTIANINVKDIIALLIVVGSFVTLGAFMHLNLPQNNKDLVSFAFGAVVATTLPNVVRYYFPTKQQEEKKP